MAISTGWMRALVLGVVALTVATTSCSDSSSPTDGTSADRSSSNSTTTTTRPAIWTATVTGEYEVNGGFRQGLARSGDGLIFSTNDGMYRTDDRGVQASPPGDKSEPAIPAELKLQTYNHVGDIDVADGMIWAPLEKPDKDIGEQVMARYDAETFAFVDSFVIAQHHAAFAAVDEDGVVYSADEFSDDTLLRYRLEGDSLEPIEPLVMSRPIERIQGADIAAGAAWLATDDDHNGLYRVDLTTGEVQDVGSMGYVDGEGEGIDAEESDGDVLLRALSCDVKLVPVRVIELLATPSP
jgi:hypothetical protein